MHYFKYIMSKDFYHQVVKDWLQYLLLYTLCQLVGIMNTNDQIHEYYLWLFVYKKYF